METRYFKKLRQLAAETGLSLDKQTGALFGEKNGYSVLLPLLNHSISVAVCLGGELPDAKALQAAVKESSVLKDCTVQGYKATYTVRSGMLVAKLHENIILALDDLTRFFRENGFQSCCQSCASMGKTDAYSVAGADALLCPVCFAQSSNAADFKAQAQSRKRENVVGGIVGAFLGALIGAVFIVIVGQSGYVAALPGVVMGVCTIKGYELLGGRLSKKGIVISVLLMLFMVYVGDRINWALAIAAEFDAEIMESFQAVPYLQQEGALTGYTTRLLMVYGFTVLGAVPTIINQLRNRENETITRKMTADI